MSATLAKDDSRRVMLLEAYDFVAVHQSVQNTVEWWEETASDMHRRCIRNDNNPFLIDLLTVCYADLERGTVVP